MIVLVAFIGLVGTIAASGLATELFKRRDLRESIRADLEVYEKLPDSPVKDKLLGDIHYRVGDLVDEPPKNSGVWVVIASAVVSNVCVWALFIASGDTKFKRGDDGVLRVYGFPRLNRDDSLHFVSFVNFAVVIFLVWLAVSFAFYRLVRVYYRRRFHREDAADEADCSQDQSPTTTTEFTTKPLSDHQPDS